MKRANFSDRWWKLKKLAAVGLLLVSLAPLSTFAQVSAFKATVPFPFVVGHQTLPAGTYIVQRFLGKPKTANDLGIIVIKASDQHVYKVIVTASSEKRRAANGSSLIFTSFKDKQYLNRVWVAGDAVAHQLANIPPEVATQGPHGEVIVTGLHYSGE